ncbi:MAG: 3-phosphoshikimate 1-carboxyvinyltransferase [Prevotella sp.]
MTYTITPPKRLKADITLPASKSISNRALVIHALSGGNVVPQNLSDCDDTEVMVRALSALPLTIDIKAAGTAMRFLTAYLAVTQGERTITGTERMRHRPIGVLVNALRYLGADISYVAEEGFPPLRIRGKELEGGSLEMAGNVSSQYISALLMIGPALRKGLTLHLTGGIISKPYIDLTLWMMREFGADAEWSDQCTICVKPRRYRQRPYFIESDWSAASYWYEMMALAGGDSPAVKLNGLADGSKQGDSVTRYIASLLGVKTSFCDTSQGGMSAVTLRKNPTHLPRLDYDFIGSPDLAQTFVVCCALKGMPFRFTGLGSLKIKETDRIEALKTELLKLGYVLKSEAERPGLPDSILSWDGERCAASFAPIDTYEDHRMAMAFAPAALVYPGIRINHPEVVSKSYPGFWDDLRKAGFGITESKTDA